MHKLHADASMAKASLVPYAKSCHSSSADLCAAGVLLYVIMAGNLPFDEPSLPALFKKIAKAAYPVPTWFTPDMVSLFKAMLNPDPHRRYCTSR